MILIMAKFTTLQWSHTSHLCVISVFIFVSQFESRYRKADLTTCHTFTFSLLEIVYQSLLPKKKKSSSLLACGQHLLSSPFVIVAFKLIELSHSAQILNVRTDNVLDVCVPVTLTLVKIPDTWTNSRLSRPQETLSSQYRSHPMLVIIFLSISMNWLHLFLNSHNKLPRWWYIHFSWRAGIQCMHAWQFTHFTVYGH